MRALTEKMRRARESVVEIGIYKFTVRRPTDQEALGLGQINLVEMAIKFVAGWDGVREIDLIPGGDANPIKFDSELWAEWCADQPEFWEPITTAILQSYKIHREITDESVKN